MVLYMAGKATNMITTAIIPNGPNGLIACFAGTRLVFFGSKKLNYPRAKIGAAKQEV
jgi:hypothetical protein